MIAYTFDALITLLPTELGGRRAPVYTGYRPNLNFNTEQYYCSEVRFANEQTELSPGESAIATIVMIPARTIRRNISAGDAFKLTEGTRVVGTAVIREVLKCDEVTIERQAVEGAK